MTEFFLLLAAVCLGYVIGLSRGYDLGIRHRKYQKYGWNEPWIPGA